MTRLGSSCSYLSLICITPSLSSFTRSYRTFLSRLSHRPPIKVILVHTNRTAAEDVLQYILKYVRFQTSRKRQPIASNTRSMQAARPWYMHINPRPSCDDPMRATDRKEAVREGCLYVCTLCMVCVRVTLKVRERVYVLSVHVARQGQQKAIGSKGKGNSTEVHLSSFAGRLLSLATLPQRFFS